MEPVDIFEKRALAALIVAGYFNMPLDKVLSKPADALEGMAVLAMREQAQALRQGLWQATLALNNEGA